MYFMIRELDYCTALLSGLPKTAINKLLIIQNAVSVLTKTRRKAHISPVLKPLHWLAVSFRIDFKILLLVFKSLSGQAPEYLSDILLMHSWVRTKNFGEAAFSVCVLTSETTCQRS